MSHPDPLYDSDNSYDDDYECDEGGFGFCRGGFAMREDDIMDNEEVFEMDGVECGREDGDCEDGPTTNCGCINCATWWTF